MNSKKICSIVFLLFLGGPFLFSQNALKQGVYSLGGSVSYSYSKNTMQSETAKQNSITLMPSYNYFLIDNLLVGSNVTFYYYELEFSNSSSSIFKDIYRRYGIGPSIRYYFPKYEVVPFVELSANYFKSVGIKQEGSRISATAGINYFISGSVAVEPYLVYSMDSFSSPDQDINTFSLGIRMNYFIVPED